MEIKNVVLEKRSEYQLVQKSTKTELYFRKNWCGKLTQSLMSDKLELSKVRKNSAKKTKKEKYF